MSSTIGTEVRRLTLDMDAIERAGFQISLYTVKPTKTPGVYLVARNGAAYRTSALQCNCAHHERRCSEVGARCKHQIILSAKLGAIEDQRTAEDRAAQAKRDRDLLW